MGKIKDQLAGISALIAAIVAIGAGFSKYGEITNKLADIESRKTVDIAPIEKSIAILQKQIEVLELDLQELKEQAKNPLAN